MKNTKKLTKKAFKDLCSFHEYGYGKRKYNAIYFDWREPTYKDNDNQRGFKYGIALHINNGTKKQLFDVFYDWINAVHLINKPKNSEFVYYRFAVTNSQRFKTPISLDLSTWK